MIFYKWHQTHACYISNQKASKNRVIWYQPWPRMTSQSKNVISTSIDIEASPDQRRQNWACYMSNWRLWRIESFGTIFRSKKCSMAKKSLITIAGPKYFLCWPFCWQVIINPGAGFASHILKRPDAPTTCRIKVGRRPNLWQKPTSPTALCTRFLSVPSSNGLPA